MTKHELEQLVKDLAEQLKALQKANARERRDLLKTIKELKDENEPPRRRRRKKEEDRINEQMKEAVKEHHERAIRLFAKLKRKEKTPTIEKFVEEHGIFNLADMDEATFIVLIRHHFNRELADAYASHQMNMRVYHSIVRYFDDSVDIKPLEVTDEMRVEAEQVTKELEEAAKGHLRLNPTSGAFHLRGRAELESFFNEQVVDIVNRFDDYAKLGMGFPKGFILEGRPGAAKPSPWSAWQSTWAGTRSASIRPASAVPISTRQPRRLRSASSGRQIMRLPSLSLMRWTPSCPTAPGFPATTTTARRRWTAS